MLARTQPGPHLNDGRLSHSPCTWNIVAQQTVMAKVEEGRPGVHAETA